MKVFSGDILLFGLGSAESFDFAEVHWASGTVQQVQGDWADQLITITEEVKPIIGGAVADSDTSIVLVDTLSVELGWKVLLGYNLSTGDGSLLAYWSSHRIPDDQDDESDEAQWDTTGVTFAWLFNGRSIYDGGELSGTQTPILTIKPVKAYHSGDYQLVVSNAAGADTSQPILLRIEADDDVPDENLPSTFALGQNYPNPFNPSTTITYDLPMRSYVTLDIFNILGQRVATLLETDQPAGRHQVSWDGTSQSGSRVASGIYFYRVEAGAFRESKKMLLLK